MPRLSRRAWSFSSAESPSDLTSASFFCRAVRRSVLPEAVTLSVGPFVVVLNWCSTGRARCWDDRMVGVLGPHVSLTTPSRYETFSCGLGAVTHSTAPATHGPVETTAKSSDFA